MVFLNMGKVFSYFLLIMTMLFWAANFYAVQIALEYYEPLSVATWRFMFGLITLFLLGFIQFKFGIFKLRFSLKEWGYIFLTGFFGIFLTIFFFNSGLKTTSPINGSLIIATSPAITAILSYFLLRKKITKVQWLAILVSFLGVTIILVKGNFDNLMQMNFVVGDLHILGMALVFSLSQIIVSKHLFHVNATHLTTISTAIALLLFLIFSIPELQMTEIPSSFEFWGSILFMGIFGTGMAYTAFYYCIVKLGATTSALFMNLIPFFTVLLAIPFGDEILGSQLIGGAIVILGLILFSRNRVRSVKLLVTRS